MGSVNSFEFVFFDIGGTLVDRDSTGDFTVFPSSKKLLNSLRNTVGVRIGVITTLGDLTEPPERNLLVQAGLADFLDPQGFTSEHSTGEVAKPDPGVYRAAAARVGVPMELTDLDKDGKWQNRFGEKPRGYFVYDVTGHVHIQIMKGYGQDRSVAIMFAILDAHFPVWRCLAIPEHLLRNHPNRPQPRLHQLRPSRYRKLHAPEPKRMPVLRTQRSLAQCSKPTSHVVILRLQ
jgi:hypothetical protein